MANGLGRTIGIHGPSKAQAEKILKAALEQTYELLRPRRDTINEVAQLLYDKGTVTGDEIYTIVEGKS